MSKELTPAVIARLNALGLKHEPFEPKKVNVFSKEALPNLTLVIDGFQRLPTGEDYLRACDEAHATAFFAVVGQTGTGRSAAAKYILERWRQQRSVDLDRLIVPLVEEVHHDHYAIFTTWMSDMSGRASELTRIPAETETQLNAALMNQALLPIFTNQYRRHATSYGTELRAAHPNAAFAVCLEEIVDTKYLKTISTIFEKADTLCICTMSPAVAENADFEAIGWKEIRLEALRGEETAEFIDAHWRQHTDAAIPFEQTIVREAFAKRVDVIGRVRTLMSDILISKLTLSPDREWNLEAFNLALEKAEAGVSAP